MKIEGIIAKRAGRWQLVSGCWLLATGFWLLAAGDWFLVAGDWFLVPGWLWAAAAQRSVAFAPAGFGMQAGASLLPTG